MEDSEDLGDMLLYISSIVGAINVPECKDHIPDAETFETESVCFVCIFLTDAKKEVMIMIHHNCPSMLYLTGIT